MKDKIITQYIRRVKKLCKSKVNGGNLLNGENAWAGEVVRYSAGIVDWTNEKLLNIDRKTKKVMEMNGCMHTRSNFVRLYLRRKEGGIDLIGTEECVGRDKKALHAYIQESNEWMLKAASNEKVLQEEKNLKDYKKWT